MSAFTTLAPEFEAFLIRAKDGTLVSGWGGSPRNARFIARNFLLEERLDPARLLNYASYLSTAAPATLDEWNKAHNKYLESHVFVKPAAGHDYTNVPADDAKICPETFRAALALAPFQSTDFDTDLVRLVHVTDLADFSGEDEAEIFSLGERALSSGDESRDAREALSRILDEAYDNCDHRPVFTAFYEDFLDVLRDPANTVWPNRLRDRLGLYHVSQLYPGGLPRRVFLFRYPVRELPRHMGHPERRPLAVPVVLDQRFSVAFCPAPGKLDRGRLLNLYTDEVEEPARELMHLFMPMKAEHLFRVGLVTTPVPGDLALARRDHLILLRILAEQETYASDTDDDLLRV